MARSIGWLSMDFNSTKWAPRWWWRKRYSQWKRQLVRYPITSGRGEYYWNSRLWRLNRRRRGGRRRNLETYPEKSPPAFAVIFLFILRNILCLSHCHRVQFKQFASMIMQHISLSLMTTNLIRWVIAICLSGETTTHSKDGDDSFYPNPTCFI